MSFSEAWGLALSGTAATTAAEGSSINADIRCWPGLDPSMATITGRKATSQRILQRLSTPRGALFYDDNYGRDLRSYLNERMTTARLGNLEAEVEAEVLKDECVLSAEVSVEYDDGRRKLTVSVALEDAEGPFAFSLSVDRLSVTALEG